MLIVGLSCFCWDKETCGIKKIKKRKIAFIRVLLIEKEQKKLKEGISFTKVKSPEGIIKKNADGIKISLRWKISLKTKGFEKIKKEEKKQKEARIF